jgi:hypothetical protein
MVSLWIKLVGVFLGVSSTIWGFEWFFSWVGVAGYLKLRVSSRPMLLGTESPAVVGTTAADIKRGRQESGDS